jgi:DNA-binding NarL/FixJ family response regulator
MVFYCCTDLIFSTKIRSTAESLGVASKAVRSDVDFTALDDDGGDTDAPDRQTSPAAVMVDLELGEDALALIRHARQARPEAQVIGFGSHVAKDVLEAAKEAGAHQVLPRSAFTEQLPDLLRQHSDG